MIIWIKVLGLKKSTWHVYSIKYIAYMLQLLSHFSHVQLFVTLWTIAHQASLYLGFSRQEYWNGLPWPPPGDLPNPGTELASLKSPELVERCFFFFFFFFFTNISMRMFYHCGILKIIVNIIKISLLSTC